MDEALAAMQMELTEEEEKYLEELSSRSGSKATSCSERCVTLRYVLKFIFSSFKYNTFYAAAK